MTAANLGEIDSVLRLIDREVWIVTASAGGRRSGLTATWVAQASIDREHPVLLVGLGPTHFTTYLVEQSHAFVAHLLKADQARLAWDFARDSGRERDKLAGLEFAQGVSGAPVLCHCLAWLDCRVFARYDAGDRLYYWADVVAGSKAAEGMPLREQAFFGSLSPQERQILLAGREADASVLRPRHAAWRAELEKMRPG